MSLHYTEGIHALGGRAANHQLRHTMLHGLKVSMLLVVEQLHVSTRTVGVFDRNLHFEDAIGSHACSLQANMRVNNGIPPGCSLLLPVDTVNCVQTLKAPLYLFGTLVGVFGMIFARSSFPHHGFCRVWDSPIGLRFI
jgi:hypothetical protein